jgi:hypothetical protein
VATTKKAAAAKKASSADEKKKSDEATLRQAYGQATTKLREAHREEFQRYYKESAEALGVEYKPRLSKEERAERDLDALLKEFPHLRSKFEEQGEGDYAEAADDDETDDEVRRFDTVR